MTICLKQTCSNFCLGQPHNSMVEFSVHLSLKALSMFSVLATGHPRYSACQKYLSQGIPSGNILFTGFLSDLIFLDLLILDVPLIPFPGTLSLCTFDQLHSLPNLSSLA